MLGITQLFQRLPGSPQPVRWGDVECSLFSVGSGFSLHISGNPCGVALTECELIWLQTYGLEADDVQFSREKVGQVARLLGMFSSWFNIAEMKGTAMRKSQFYHGKNLVFGAPFEESFRFQLTALTDYLKECLQPFDLAEKVITHHPEGLHATLAILWEQREVPVDEIPLLSWSMGQSPVDFCIKRNEVTPSPFFVSGNGLIGCLAQSGAGRIADLRRGAGEACKIEDNKNGKKETCHILLGYLDPWADWNREEVINAIIACINEINAFVNIESVLTEMKIVEYIKQTLEPTSCVRVVPLPIVHGVV